MAELYSSSIHPSQRWTPTFFLLRIPLSPLALPLTGSLVLALCLCVRSNGRVSKSKSTVRGKDTTSSWGWATRLGLEIQKPWSVGFSKLKRRSGAQRSKSSCQVRVIKFKKGIANYSPRVKSGLCLLCKILSEHSRTCVYVLSLAAFVLR